VEWVGALVALAVTAIATCGSLLVALIATAAPFLVLWWLYRQGLFDPAKWGRVFVIGIPAPTAPQARYVKRGTCRSCGSPKVKPSQSAYVYCDFCGELMDWDFRAAMSDRRSKAPGPAYEGLLAQLRPQIEAARASGDKAAYEAVQLKLWAKYAELCPAALSPRIGDARYRDRYVRYAAAQQTAIDLDPTCKAAFDGQQVATAGLVWDRSNPFQPKAEPASFHRLVDAVLAYQKAAAAHTEACGVLALHPDRPPAEILPRIGASALVQGWMPYIAKADADRLLETCGLTGEYVAFTPIEEVHGKCDGCAAPLDVPKGAKRVLCHHCGAYSVLAGGHFPCHGCGAPIDVPDSGAAFSCQACGAHLSRLATA
jgi:LSD1 subclass zinc finger protein